MLAAAITQAQIIENAYHWWMGDALGIALVSPFILAWWQSRPALRSNPAELAMIKASSIEQVTGRELVNIVAPEYRNAFTYMHARVLSGDSVQMQFRIKRYTALYETSAVPLPLNGETLQLAVTRDITDRKFAEEQLKKLNITS